MNHLLSGKAPSCLAPWLCGAPLTALRKKGGGVRPIAVGEVLRRLARRAAFAVLLFALLFQVFFCPTVKLV